MGVVCEGVDAVCLVYWVIGLSERKLCWDVIGGLSLVLGEGGRGGGRMRGDYIGWGEGNRWV